LVLAYEPELTADAIAIWQQLVGIIKYLVRTQKPVTKLAIKTKLNLSDRSFHLGLKALYQFGFQHQIEEDEYRFSLTENIQKTEPQLALNNFLSAVKEEKFQQQYFHQVPLPTITQQLLT